MEFQIGEFMKGYKPRVFRPKTRLEWIKDFYKELWRDWNAYMPEPLTIQILAIRMRNVPLAEMPVLWNLCKESQSFSKFFWWRIKRYPPKKKEKKPKQCKLI